MNKDKPTTDEIVQALRFCDKSSEIECYECVCRVSGGENLCRMNKLADRLEAQEREIERLMVACEIIHQENQAMIDCHKPNLDKIAELTTRAENAEAERDAAIKDVEHVMFLHPFAEGCCACDYAKDDCVECPVLNGAGECKPKWRGLPQEGEGL